jgi:hypothetical protein
LAWSNVIGCADGFTTADSCRFRDHATTMSELPEHVARNRAYWDARAADFDAIELGCGTAYVSAWLTWPSEEVWRARKRA